MRFITFKKEKNKYNNCSSAFASFAPIFYFKLCSFCWWGCKNVSCPRT